VVAGEEGRVTPVRVRGAVDQHAADVDPEPDLRCEVLVHGSTMDSRTYERNYLFDDDL